MDAVGAAALGHARSGTNDPLATCDAVRLADRVRGGELSAVELVTAALERIAKYDPALNAFTDLRPEAALAEAEQADRLLARGGEVGPLHGIPMSVKDAIWVAGMKATNGSQALREFVPSHDAEAVRRLRSAGAIVVGKTNNPEFCFRGFTDNPLYGPTRNPWDLTRTPGGSSGGSGAAVAARLTPLSLGSDGGGSVRIPASFCGVAGFKPSRGLVPTWPGFRGWESLTVLGPLAGSVRDLGLCFDVLADGATAPGRPRQTGRIAYSVDLGFAAVDPEIRSAFARTLERLEALGWQLAPATPIDWDPEALWNTIALCEGHAAAREFLDQPLTADTRALILEGSAISAVDYLDASHERVRYTRTWEAFFERFDFLLSPTMPLTAFALGVTAPTEIDGNAMDPAFDAWCGLCLAANLTGQPAVSIPCACDRQGMPIGLQLIGPWSSDRQLLAAAAKIEQALDPLPVPPLLRSCTQATDQRQR